MEQSALSETSELNCTEACANVARAILTVRRNARRLTAMAKIRDCILKKVSVQEQDVDGGSWGIETVRSLGPLYIGDAANSFPKSSC